MTGEQNGPVRSGRARRLRLDKQAPAAKPTTGPQGTKFGLIDVITGIAVALALLVGGTMALTAVLGGPDNGGQGEQPAAYCVDQYGNAAPPGACR